MIDNCGNQRLKMLKEGNCREERIEICISLLELCPNHGYCKHLSLPGLAHNKPISKLLFHFVAQRDQGLRRLDSAFRISTYERSIVPRPQVRLVDQMVRQGSRFRDETARFDWVVMESGRYIELSIETHKETRKYRQLAANIRKVRSPKKQNLMIIDGRSSSAVAAAAVVLLVCMEMLGGIAGHSSHSSSSTPLPPSSSNLTGNNGKVSAFYVLGDSSVDCGENTLFYPFLHKNLSLHPCSGSDTSLIPHFLAEKMGLRNSPPFYGQNGSVDCILKGLNFGSAEATIMNFGDRRFQSLNQQIRQVLETFQLVQLHLTEEQAREFMESSVTYLSFGKDDYVEHFRHNFTGSILEFTGQEFAGILVNQMTVAIMKLYHANVRKIVCMGILPLGCAPRIVWEWRNWMSGEGGGRGKACVKEINELIVQYNTKMQDRITKLNRELTDAKIVFCDIYRGIMEIIANPKRHGMEDVRGACCGFGWNGALVGCLARGMACRRESAHVWWDLYNPTQEVNRLLADSAWSGDRDHLLSFGSICHPVSIQKLVATSVSSSSGIDEDGTYDVARLDQPRHL